MMALRWCILLGLLAVARSQQVLNFTSAEQLEMDIAGRYGSDDAVDRRREHLYCLGYYVESGGGDDNRAVGNEFFPYPADDQIWTLYMQFPALAYLDINRKAALFRLVLQVAGLSAMQAEMVVETNLCQGALEFYEVTEYAESVLARIYFGTSGTVSLPGGVPSSASALADDFQNAFLASTSGGIVSTFLGRRAINLLQDQTFREDYQRGLPPGSNLHPGSVLPNDRDPTFLPIILGSWGQNVTLSEAEDGVNGIVPRNIQNRAGNPNPINYGLEAGDIVFSVIGAILLTGVVALVVLGFCIHPFFLA